jgi:putative membrane protein
MGAADVVPGVSGGTMAFITGIYQELILSIRSIDLNTLRLVLTFRVKEALDRVRWEFLLAVLIGILVAILSLAKGIQWLLEHRPVLIWSFFFGLVFASVLTVRKQVTKWDVRVSCAAIISTLFAYVIVGSVSVETPDAPWFIFLCGVIAICAMILPGISGSFILVLLGKYHHILSALNERDIVVIATFSLGAAIGILSFAQLLNWVFKRYHNLAIALLTGLMAGSLRKVWPWKETLSTMTNRHGEQVPVDQLNVLPAGLSVEVVSAVGLAFLGFAIVVLLDRVASSRADDSNSSLG